MAILSVEGLNKSYAKFQLKDVSFSLEKGYIMGFIGANGAGKTTTLKSILGMVQADSGNIQMFDQDYHENEKKLKPQIGFMLGGVDYYAKSKVKTITDVVKEFYPNWDKSRYEYYMKRFNIDEDKKVSELSHGMRVKYSLALALSHHATLFILDEPTSGLDPIARDDLLELFQELIEDGEKSILFSTHITSDLEKCADYITYINNGKIIASSAKEDLIDSYKLIQGSLNQLEGMKTSLIAYKVNSFGFTGLIKTDSIIDEIGYEISTPNLEDIMIYYAKREDKNEELAL